MILEHKTRYQQSRRELEMLAIRERFARQEEEARAAAQARQKRVDAQAEERARRERHRIKRLQWSLEIIRLAREHTWAKILPQLRQKLKPPEYEVLDRHPNPEIGELIILRLPEMRITAQFLMARCPRNGIIAEGVPQISDIDGLPILTALAAQAWRIGDPLSEYIPPPRRT